MRFYYAVCTVATAFTLSTACGGGGAPTVNDVDPETISGGGITSGAILGELNVTVLDGITEEAIAGARVQVGEPENPAPLWALTNADGVATLRDDALVGGQTITVVADGYAPTTWFGANGANVTMQLRLRVEPAASTAQVSGTIDGWDELEDPAPGHYRVGYVTYSRSEDFDLPENDLEQPTDGQGRARNMCLYGPPNYVPPCAWQLTTRVGPQAIYAFVLDVDTVGTPEPDDDVTTLITYGLMTGLDLERGEQREHVALSLIDPADLVDVTVAFPDTFVGLDEVQVYPYVDLGDEGRLVFSVPPLTPAAPTATLPALHNALAGASYEFRAIAEPPSGDGVEGTVAYLRMDTLAETLTFVDWLPQPSNVSVVDGVYSFSPVAGASVHSAKLEDSDGNPVWYLLMLDGRTSFTLPPVTPDPFPTGDATLFVSAMVFPGFDPMSFSSEILGDTVSHSARRALLLPH